MLSRAPLLLIITTRDTVRNTYHPDYIFCTCAHQEIIIIPYQLNGAPAPECRKSPLNYAAAQMRHTDRKRDREMETWSHPAAEMFGNVCCARQGCHVSGTRKPFSISNTLPFRVACQHVLSPHSETLPAKSPRASPKSDALVAQSDGEKNAGCTFKYISMFFHMSGFARCTQQTRETRTPAGGSGGGGCVGHSGFGET